MRYRIITDSPGQTCNRFFSYLESVSWAILNNKKVYVLLWDSSLKYYKKLQKNKYISFPFYNSFLIKTIGEERLLYYISRLFSHIKKIPFCEFVKGWDIRECDVYYPQVRKTANALFVPEKKITEYVDTLFEKMRNEHHVIVGVHLRKGDYKRWFDGKYYFEDEVYEHYIVQIERLLGGGNIFPMFK